MTANKDHLGGIIHVYQKYDPVEFPSPTAEPPDLVSPAMEHLLTYGSMRERMACPHHSSRNLAAQVGELYSQNCWKSSLSR